MHGKEAAAGVGTGAGGRFITGIAPENRLARFELSTAESWDRCRGDAKMQRSNPKP
jgi:hypothetical protein